MKNISYNGLDLIRSSQANLEWWINTSHSKTLTRQAYDLIVKIMNDFNDGINNMYHFKRFELLKHMDIYLDALIEKDPIAQAVDMRIIYNLPEEEFLNESYITKAAPYNITYHG
jgi:hypothetical protein